MSVLNKKNSLKDISIQKDNFCFEDLSPKRTRGRPKKTNKKNCTYTFYCTKEELETLNLKAKEKNLDLPEYFRIKLFAK
ncbi:hypothetical protein CU197059_000199 [Campylobacter upsaliensis]|nr:hypothetical protein [Campylobacter upsaliensis]CAG9469720.1 hypothetical protein CU197059_000199 [Campylobacter upsaliensis]